MRIDRVSILAFAVIAVVAFTSFAGFAVADVEPDITGNETIEEATDHAIDISAEAHADGADAHHQEIDGLPQLDFTTYTSQIFWMFAAFIMLYILFSKKSIPEISGSVESRREKIQGDLDNAHEFKDQANKVHAEYEAALQVARETASETFKDTEDSIKENSNARLEAFKDRANKLTQETEGKLEKAKDAAMEETQDIAAEIASIAAEKIVGIPTDIKQAQNLVKNIGRKAA